MRPAELPAELLSLVRAGKLHHLTADDPATINHCLTLSADDSGVQLWVNSPDFDAPRFVVHLVETDGELLGTAEQTNSVREILHYLADHFDIR